MAANRGAGLILVLLLAGCSKSGSPVAASREFIDRYYIERDHAKALEVAEGGAAERIRSERKLLEEAGTGGYTGVQPRVFYNLQSERPIGDQTELIYNLTVDSSGVQLRKEVRIVVRKVGSEYKVTFFHDRDLPRK
jgi:hypothetical protein